MKVNHMRIDDRLIHGQIVTAWISDSKADTIVVADDVAAKDPTQQMLLKFAVPSGIKLFIKTMKESVALLNQESNEKVLLIVRNPASALEMFQEGFHLDSLNVGNISNARSVSGRKKLLNYVFVEKQDVENLRMIALMGIKLDVRSVPNDKSIDGMDLLAKY